MLDSSSKGGAGVVLAKWLLWGTLGALLACLVGAPPAAAQGLGGVKQNGEATLPDLSADGRWVAFQTQAWNLSPDDLGNFDIYVRGVESGTTILVSRATGAAGVKGNENSVNASISADGRYVAFASQATNLSPDDPDTTYDVYRRDLRTGSTVLVSRAGGAAGEKGNHDSAGPGISADGRYVVFNSVSSNLDPDDPVPPPVGTTSVYVRDLVTNTTTLASRSGPDDSYTRGSGYSISDDGRFVPFTAGFPQGETPHGVHNGDLYVRDLQTQTTALISRAGGPAGAVGNGPSFSPQISADGRYVAFESNASNLSPDDPVSNADVYLRDLHSQTTTLVSRASGAAGPGANGNSRVPFISANGRYVGFESASSNLDPADTDGFPPDVYVRDLQTHITVLVGRASGAAGAKASPGSEWITLSADGRFAAYHSAATNLSADDTDALSDVYVRDLQTHLNTLESRATAGYPRPKSATPLHAPLVLAYTVCAAPNRVHAAPLPYGSCTPPAKSSGHLTVGTPDANGLPPESTGSVRLRSIGGDVATAITVTDVRNSGDLSDYAGELRVRATVRATDRLSPLNAGEMPAPATIADVEFGPAVPCATTPGPPGSTCSIDTTVNALIPGAVVAGSRSIWQIGQIEVMDGGPDGDGDTTGDNSPFLRQGLFVP
jgi:Tol biopolymer transport system component